MFAIIPDLIIKVAEDIYILKNKKISKPSHKNKVSKYLKKSNQIEMDKKIKRIEPDKKILQMFQSDKSILSSKNIELVNNNKCEEDIL